jgi:hypothetical protein
MLFDLEAAETLSGIRSLDDNEISFVRGIGIIKGHIIKAQKQLIVLLGRATRLFQHGGLEQIKEENDTRKY